MAASWLLPSNSPKISCSLTLRLSILPNPENTHKNMLKIIEANLVNKLIVIEKLNPRKKYILVFWNGGVISFCCQIATQGQLALSDKDWYYLEVRPIQVGTTSRMGPDRMPPVHFVVDPCVKQGVFSKDHEDEVQPSGFLEMTHG